MCDNRRVSADIKHVTRNNPWCTWLEICSNTILLNFPCRSQFSLNAAIPAKGEIEAGFLEEEALTRAWDAEGPGAWRYVHGPSALLEGPGMEKGPGAARLSVPMFAVSPTLCALESELQNQATFAEISHQSPPSSKDSGHMEWMCSLHQPSGGPWADPQAGHGGRGTTLCRTGGLLRAQPHPHLTRLTWFSIHFSDSMQVRLRPS